MQSPRGLRRISCALEKSALRTQKTPNSSTQLILGKLYFVFNACRALKTYFHDGASAESGWGSILSILTAGGILCAYSLEGY